MRCNVLMAALLHFTFFDVVCWVEAVHFEGLIFGDLPIFSGNRALCVKSPRVVLPGGISLSRLSG